MPKRTQNHKSLPRQTRARSAAVTKIYRAAADAYRDAVRAQQAGKTARATQLFQKADRLLKAAGKSGMDGPVGRLPNPKRRAAWIVRLQTAKGKLLEYRVRAHDSTAARARARDFARPQYGKGTKVISVAPEPRQDLLEDTEDRPGRHQRGYHSLPHRQKGRLPNPSFSDIDIDDVWEDAMKLGTQEARALGRSEREHRQRVKRYHVTWYSPKRGKRTGFVAPIEAHTANDAKRQAKAMVTNDPKASNFVAKEVARNPSAKRDSAGSVDVIRYYVSPKPSTITGWYVKGVRISEDGREVVNSQFKWIEEKTKRGARHVAAMLNAELKRLGRYKAINPGLIDLAANLQAADFVQKYIGGSKKRKRNPPTGKIFANAWQNAGRFFWVVYRDSATPYIFGQGESGSLSAARKVAQALKRSLNETETGRKRNPSLTQLSETFQGKASGTVTEYKAASSAPSNLARTGKLVLFELAGVRRAIRVPGAMVAMDTKEKLWLVGPRAPMFKKKAKPGTVDDYGEIKRIVYLTAKAHIESGKLTEYDHDFENPRPRLLVDSDGMPIFKGGGYTIRAEGITG